MLNQTVKFIKERKDRLLEAFFVGFLAGTGAFVAVYISVYFLFLFLPANDLEIRFIESHLYVNQNDEINIYPCENFEMKAISQDSVFVECDGQMIQLNSSYSFAKEIYMDFGPLKNTSMNSKD